MANDFVQADGTFSPAQLDSSGALKVYVNNAAAACAIDGVLKCDGDGEIDAYTWPDGLVKGDGTDADPEAAVAGVDYAPATTGTALLKGDGAGGTEAAAAGTDYLAPGGLAVGQTKTVITTEDITITTKVILYGTGTFTDISALTVNLEGGCSYTVAGFLLVVLPTYTSSPNPGVIQIGGSSVADKEFILEKSYETINWASLNKASEISRTGFTTIFSGEPPSEERFPVALQGSTVISTSGTLFPRMSLCEDYYETGQVLTLKAGSYLQVTRVS